jgi:hypothetical protein
MADTKISAGTDATTLNATDKLPIARSGSTTKFVVTGTEVATFVRIGTDEIITVPMAVITAQAGAVVVAARSPYAGTIEGIAGTVNAAFTTTDIVITGINTTGITTGVVTIPTAGSAALTTATATPSALKTVAIGDIINFTITGGVGAVSGAVTFILRRT